MLLRTVARTSPAAVRAGFTLMELLVVVAILVVLAGVAVPVYLGYKSKADRDVTQATVDAFARDLRTAFNTHGLNYDQLKQLADAGDWGILTLPPGKSPPLDAWKRPLRWDVVLIQTSTGDAVPDPIVISDGPDPSNPGDDISSISAGGAMMAP
jgi:prepilin-type N-terminal cleavage/methylation domain-containing protein